MRKRISPGGVTDVLGLFVIEQPENDHQRPRRVFADQFQARLSDAVAVAGGVSTSRASGLGREPVRSEVVVARAAGYDEGRQLLDVAGDS